ncbi:MAG: 50S ribosomal protein L3 [Bdellovibrionales bacterium]|nr:50S ribosomal protein L3 [Bdellovibrionales bacterium]
MTLGIVGRKSGMTRIFNEDGASLPVTVIEVTPNRVTQIKTPEIDGYSAVQVAYGQRRASRVNKAAAGHFAKAGVEGAEGLVEFLVDNIEPYELGSVLPLTAFEAGQVVDVVGTTKGKGFQGAVKRWNFKTQDATHGNSLSHRAPGSIGQNQSPGRVFKGKKMFGHMGDRRQTTQNLELVGVDVERNLLMIKGAVPGAPGGVVIVKPAVKAKASS